MFVVLVAMPKLYRNSPPSGFVNTAYNKGNRVSRECVSTRNRTSTQEKSSRHAYVVYILFRLQEENRKYYSSTEYGSCDLASGEVAR